MLLILEDTHNCDNVGVQSAIDLLLVARPKNLQIIITSRLPLPANQARFTAQAKLLTIEQSELEFTKNEIDDYLRFNLNLDLSQEQVHLLHERTKGWIAAIGLAMSALEKIISQKIIWSRNLSGFKGNIYDFFAEEVYRHYRFRLGTILKKISIARSINGEIVNIFTGQVDGEQILKDISKHNTFIIENLEGAGHFQLHPLFAEFLVTRFRNEEGADTIQQTHRSLADYYLFAPGLDPSCRTRN